MRSLRPLLTLFLGFSAPLLAQDQWNDQWLVQRVQRLETFTLITRQRVPLAAKYSALCGEIRNPADHTTLIGKPDAAILVYVSAEGLGPFKEERYPLPEGTLILKEKFASHDAKSPELYTGMLKREKGYNPKAGDWEFFTLSGSRGAITSRGRIDSCMDCHQHRAKSDFLMRQTYSQYLTASRPVAPR